MALNIPNVGSNFDSFDKGLGRGSDIMQRMMMNPYDMAYKQAETKKASAEGDKATMLTNLMKEHPDMIGYFMGLGELPGTKRSEDYRMKQKEIDDKALALLSSHSHAIKTNWAELQRIRKGLTDRPDLTGPGQGILNQINMSNDKALGNVIPAFGDVQANMAQSAARAQGTGIKMMNWAGRTKMSEFSPHEMNMGKLEAVENKMREDYKSMRDQAHDLTGQEFPTWKQFVEESPDEQAKTMAQVSNPQTELGQQPQLGSPQQPNTQPAQAPQAPGQPSKIKESEITPEIENQVFSQMDSKMRANAERAIKRGINRKQVIIRFMEHMGVEER